MCQPLDRRGICRYIYWELSFKTCQVFSYLLENLVLFSISCLYVFKHFSHSLITAQDLQRPKEFSNLGISETFTVKHQIINILDFAGYTVSVLTTQFSPGARKQPETMRG